MKKVIIIAVSLLAVVCLSSCTKKATQCICKATLPIIGEYTTNSEASDGKCEDLDLSYQGVKLECKAK